MFSKHISSPALKFQKVLAAFPSMCCHVLIREGLAVCNPPALHQYGLSATNQTPLSLTYKYLNLKIYKE